MEINLTLNSQDNPEEKGEGWSYHNIWQNYTTVIVTKTNTETNETE
jgi:hypothetical protein